MKKLLILACLLASSQNVFSTISVKNATPFSVKVVANFSVCENRSVTIESGHEEQIGSKGCLLTSLRAEVYEKMTGGQHVAGIDAERTRYTKNVYKSSGTGYSNFIVFGPMREDDTTYYVSRLVD